MSTPPPPHRDPPLSETDPSQSSSSNRCSRLCERILGWRGWLIYLAWLMVTVIIVGIVFTAHKYYRDMGGQGFLKLKSRSLGQASENTSAAQVYLTSKRIRIYEQEMLDLVLGITDRSPTAVPWYTCGDQQSSCEAYGHAEICCPVEMICQPTTHTSSHIFCCNGTLSHHACRILRSHARCRPQYYECSEEMGGGCCPNTMTCFQDQCIPVIERPSSLNISNTTTATPLPGGPVPREGEIARGSRVISSMLWDLGHPSSTLGLLACTAIVMGML